MFLEAQMSTSKLQRYVSEKLGDSFQGHEVYENIRPDWLRSKNATKLELDFYIPDLKIAIEVQGIQHFCFVEHFHRTYENYEYRKETDRDKKELCYGQGISLIEIFTTLDADILLKDLLDRFHLDNQVDLFRTASIEHKRNRFYLKIPTAPRPPRQCPQGYDITSFRSVLFTYTAVSLAWVRARRGFNGFVFENSGMPYELIKYIRVRLDRCKTKEDVQELFKAIDNSLRYDLTFI